MTGAKFSTVQKRYMTTLFASAATFRRSTLEKVLFVALNQVDLVLTLAAVSSGYIELNSIMRMMLASPFQLILFKTVIPVIIAWAIPGRLLLPSLALLVMVLGYDVKELIIGIAR